MATPFRLSRRHSYQWWFALTAVAALGFYFLLVPIGRQTPELLLSLLGGVVAFFHFLYAQHSSNTETFISLFREFNARFDSMNAALNRIREMPSGALLSAQDKQILFDYYNLCAEEYHYFKSGYIDNETWRSWVCGMQYFASSEPICRTWIDELGQGSYYGFPPSLLLDAV